MNPRQRRGFFVLILAGIGAVAVFTLVGSYVADIEAQVGPTVPGLRLAREVRAYEPITPDLVRSVQIPERWAPRTMLRAAESMADQVAGTTLPGGTLLQEGMLVTPPDIEAGERELAILVDAETGVAGKIGPGVTVDIYATFADSPNGPAHSRIVVQNAEIVGVGVVRDEQTTDGQFTDNAVVPVTFAISVEESLAIAYAESFAQEVRLGLRSPSDRDPLSDDERVFGVDGFSNSPSDADGISGSQTASEEEE
jgi:pilus assembly protein CpaB